jgi:hypothetical protein
MNRFEPRPIRAVFAFAAAVLTALTLALGVVVPAALAPAAGDAGRSVAARSAAPTEVAIVPDRIEVIGVRPRELAAEPGVHGAVDRPRG